MTGDSRVNLSETAQAVMYAILSGVPKGSVVIGDIEMKLSNLIRRETDGPLKELISSSGITFTGSMSIPREIESSRKGCILSKEIESYYEGGINCGLIERRGYPTPVYIIRSDPSAEGLMRQKLTEQQITHLQRAGRYLVS